MSRTFLHFSVFFLRYFRYEGNRAVNSVFLSGFGLPDQSVAWRAERGGCRGVFEVVGGGSEEFRIVIEEGQAFVYSPVEDPADQAGTVAVVSAVPLHRFLGDSADASLVPEDCGVIFRRKPVEFHKPLGSGVHYVQNSSFPDTCEKRENVRIGMLIREVILTFSHY